MKKPTNAEFKVIFDSVADRYDAISNPYAVRRRLEFFVSRAIGDVLEVGAGTGETAHALKEKEFNVIGTDNSPLMVTEMKKKGVDARECDAETLPFQDKSFDTIVGGEMIYYLDEPERFLKEAYRVLRSGGKFLLSSANNTTRFYDRLRAVLRVLRIGQTYFDDKTRTFVTTRDLINLVTKAGFRDVCVNNIMPIPVEFLDPLNRVLERTPLRYASIFLFLSAKK